MCNRPKWRLSRFVLIRLKFVKICAEKILTTSSLFVWLKFCSVLKVSWSLLKIFYNYSNHPNTGVSFSILSWATFAIRNGKSYVYDFIAQLNVQEIYLMSSVWLPNGPDFKWHLKSIPYFSLLFKRWSEYLTNLSADEMIGNNRHEASEEQTIWILD